MILEACLGCANGALAPPSSQARHAIGGAGEGGINCGGRATHVDAAAACGGREAAAAGTSNCAAGSAVLPFLTLCTQTISRNGTVNSWVLLTAEPSRAEVGQCQGQGIFLSGDWRVCPHVSVQCSAALCLPVPVLLLLGGDGAAALQGA